MTQQQENPQIVTADPQARDGTPTPAAGAPPEASQARIVEEHHVTGASGEDEIEAIDDRGRRWYHVRPAPRYRADVLGFNYSWWLVLIVALVVFLPWGWWY
jgi:hypothetical protein